MNDIKLVLFRLSNPIARFALVSVFVATLTSACSSDPGSRNQPNTESSGPAITTNSVSDNPDTGSSDNAVGGSFQISLDRSSLALTEGGAAMACGINAIRQGGQSSPITLALRGNSPSDENNLRWTFSDEQLDTSESSASVTIELGIARSAIMPQTRSFTVVATDGSTTQNATIQLDISPTTRPDVYLLIGQSNMVGFSLPGARESDSGEADATDARIFQLNVTGNDPTNFPSPAAFTNSSTVANPGARSVLALDPLHDGFDFSINSKESTRIGLGLSFARAMLSNTTSNLYLVPSAWSDTGFCQTDTLLYPGQGWNATQPDDTDNFAGTLLHDRALTRLNLTLQETGGIFRGILWHQGEADSNDAVCAAAYESNLSALVASLRSLAQVDARGPQARGAAADIPFIVGTMSRGEEFADFSAPKQQVDGVHRIVSSIIPFAATVINDDLVPPAFPCGQGSCIHFGATALREMGSRYAERMLEVQRR